MRKLLAKQVPLLFACGLFPASVMSSLTMFPYFFKAPGMLEDSLKVQAKFATTHNLEDLHEYLPYRKRLAESGDKKQLAQYDAVLNRVLNEAEFYEMGSPGDFQKQLGRTWKTPLYRKESDGPFDGKTLRTIWKFLSSREFRQQFQGQQFQLQGKYIDALTPEKLAKPFESLSPLSKRDDPTRYLVAGQVADLFFKHPEYLDGVMNSSRGFPLRFLITKDSPTLALGSYINGLNVITLNKTCLWLPKGKNTTAQHEFVHAASGGHGVVGDLLPFMSEQQQKDFKIARSSLVAQHEQQGSSWYGRLKYFLTGKTATGIRNYAFFNDYEFLTVTLDTFKKNPKGLCQTEAGKSVYHIYKELLGLDPLRELPHAGPDPLG